MAGLQARKNTAVVSGAKIPAGKRLSILLATRDVENPPGYSFPKNDHGCSIPQVLLEPELLLHQENQPSFAF